MSTDRLIGIQPRVARTGFEPAASDALDIRGLPVAYLAISPFPLYAAISHGGGPIEGDDEVLDLHRRSQNEIRTRSIRPSEDRWSAICLPGHDTEAEDSNPPRAARMPFAADIRLSSAIVLPVRLELTRPHGHENLNLARLPNYAKRAYPAFPGPVRGPVANPRFNLLERSPCGIRTHSIRHFEYRWSACCLMGHVYDVR